MASQLASLAVVMLVAVLAPFVASLVPGRAIPEVVFLVLAGALLGPHGMGLVQASGTSLELLSELGMAFLFLMAGYEIRPSDILSKTGAHASLCWLASFAAAMALVGLTSFSRFEGMGGVAFAIMLTTTAYGTLAPIMRARNLTGTRVGRAVTVYGATGEVLPILAMAVLLTTRSPLVTTLLLLIFLAVCVRLATLPHTSRRLGVRLREFLGTSAGSSSQALVRIVVLLLVFLLALAELFDLDTVLGAFAAGFVLRAILPEGEPALEEKLEGIGNGFLIPTFFVLSGAKIDLAAAFADPALLVLFIGLLVAIRGVSVAVSLRVNPETRGMSGRETFVTAAYCVMALPLVVAITGVATDAGFMAEQDASVLVTAGAITVLVIPVVTALVRLGADAHPVRAARVMVAGGERPADVLARQREELHASRERFRQVRERHHEEGGRSLTSADYLALGEEDDQREQG